VVPCPGSLSYRVGCVQGIEHPSSILRSPHRLRRGILNPLGLALEGMGFSARTVMCNHFTTRLDYAYTTLV